MSFIGVDLGATFIKAAWLDPRSDAVRDERRVAFPAFEPQPPGRREVPVEPIFQSTLQLLEGLLRSRNGDCQGIFLCGQMHGFVFVQQGGSGGGNFISWQDRRCLEAGQDGRSHFDVAKEVLGPSLISRLGNEFRPGLPAATLHGMARAGTLPDNSMPLALADYVAVRLTSAPPVTHVTNAAAHGLFDLQAGRWSSEALERLGLQGLRMPTLAVANEPLGFFSFGRGKIPVFPPVGDQQAALLGAGLAPGELSINIGTGSQVACLAEKPQEGPWQMRPYFDNLWLRTVTHLPAGRALNRLVFLFCQLAEEQGTPIKDPWKLISQLVAHANPKSIRVNLSFFPTVLGSEGAIQGILEEELEVGALFRASFRNMGENYLRAGLTVSPKGWKSVVFSGGLALKNEILRSEILRCVGNPHRVSNYPEDTLMGLLALGKRIKNSSAF